MTLTDDEKTTTSAILRDVIDSAAILMDVIKSALSSLADLGSDESSPRTDSVRHEQLGKLTDVLPRFLTKATTAELAFIGDALLAWSESHVDDRDETEKNAESHGRQVRDLLLGQAAESDLD